MWTLSGWVLRTSAKIPSCFVKIPQHFWGAYLTPLERSRHISGKVRFWEGLWILLLEIFLNPWERSWVVEHFREGPFTGTGKAPETVQFPELLNASLCTPIKVFGHLRESSWTLLERFSIASGKRKTIQRRRGPSSFAIINGFVARTVLARLNYTPWILPLFDTTLENFSFPFLAPSYMKFSIWS